jgi:hypothetical protein
MTMIPHSDHRMIAAPLFERLRRVKRRVPRIAVEHLGIRPSWLGYRWWHEETVPQHLARAASPRSRYQTVHPAAIHHNPLPRNVERREELPDDRGWWGFSFRDVPERPAAETFLATIPDCRVVTYVEDEPDHPFVGDFYVALQTHDERSLELREVRFRPKHAERLLAGLPVQRFERAAWVLERVYHNYSHWLTAHLPKFLLLRDRGLVEDVVLPPTLPAPMEASLRRLGFEPRDFRTFDPDAALQVDELILIGSDRFRPELVSSVRDAVWKGSTPAPRRKVLISRARARRRRLINEEAVWRTLEPHGFERVVMEDRPFEAQMELMMDTAVLVAPHGAGLTNMIFCAPGTHIVEIADLSFPNPNFYALASALRHPYWLIPADAVGDGHPLARDMIGDESALRRILPALLGQVP